MGPLQFLPLQVKVDLGIKQWRGNPYYLKAPELVPNYLMRCSVITRKTLLFTGGFATIGINMELLIYFQVILIIIVSKYMRHKVISSQTSKHLDISSRYILPFFFSGERKTCTSENSLQKLSKKPNKHKCLKTKNGTISISRHIYKGTDRIHSKSDR